MSNIPGVSVIICCYNSSDRIIKTLEFILDQNVSEGVRWEVIIVDNASTDNTKEIVNEFREASRALFPIVIIEEKNPGLKNAREAGLKHSTYEYLLLVDDDNHLSNDYVTTAFELMNLNSQTAMIGGLGTAMSTISLPEWFEEVKLLYAVGPQFTTSGPIDKNAGYIYGAGMVIRKSAWQHIIDLKFPFASSDRKGSSLSGGHDVELSWAFRLAGFTVEYSHRLKFTHFIEAQRLQWEYAKRLAKGSSHNFVPFVFYVLMNKEQVSTFSFRFFLMKRIVTSFIDSGKWNAEKKETLNDLELIAYKYTTSYLIHHFSEVVNYFKKVKQFNRDLTIDQES